MRKSAIARRTETRIVDVRFGALQVRLAETPADIEAAQALRYRVFYQEMGAHPTMEMALAQRDFDAFDRVCDHLLVIDQAKDAGGDAVVGTYRLIRRAAAQRHGRFYTASEYDISRIEAYPGALLELGRSCVESASRTRATMQLLWRGIAAYVFHYGIELMFGCASLPGTDPDGLALPLSYLYHYHLAPPELRARALPERFVEMNRQPKDSINPAQALPLLPPLLKGYLRLGGFVGDGAVVDHQFNTTDVCVLVKTDLVTEKYYRHYERRARADAVA
jgi:putative hemolysin